MSSSEKTKFAPLCIVLRFLVFGLVFFFFFFQRFNQTVDFDFFFLFDQWWGPWRLSPLYIYYNKEK